MINRPKHVQRALDELWAHLYGQGSVLPFGDLQQVNRYLVRLERQIADWERPSVFVRIRRAIAARVGR